MLRLSRRRLLGGLAVALVAGVRGGGALAASCPTGAGLAALGCSKGVLFGAAVSSDDLTVPEYARLVADQCAVLVPTWEMKWGALQRQPGQFDFARADRIAAFAREHGMALRGHTLIWYQNMPDWLSSGLSPVNWNETMTKHVAAVVGHYRDSVASWDVVNEAVEPEHGRGDGLRINPWLAAAGPGYVAAAFKLAARFAAPDSRLVYNDYGVEHEAEWTRKRRVAILRLLESLRNSDAPVTGFGMQSHLRVGDAFDARALTRFIDEVKGFGITPMVTEFDVRADRESGAAAKDAKVASLGRAYLDTVLAAGCDTVVCWGLTDDKNWRGKEDPDDRPLPYDRNLAPKAFRGAIEAALAASPGWKSTAAQP